MSYKELSKGMLRVVFILSGIVLLLWFLYTISSLLIDIVIAIIITMLARPLVKILNEKLGLRRSLSAFFTMLFLILLTLGFTFLFVPLLKTQSENLALLDTKVLVSSIINIFEKTKGFFEAKGISILGFSKSTVVSTVNTFIPKAVNSVFKALGNIGITIFNVSFITFFFLKDRLLLEKLFLKLFTKNYRPKIKISIKKIRQLLSRYFLGLVFQVLILLIIYTVILLILGVENAFIIAFLCAGLNLIPYIGPIIAFVLMLVFTMIGGINEDFFSHIFPNLTYVSIGFIIGQLIDNLFTQPIVFSRSIKSHPLEIFFSILIGSLLYGIVGMVVAVPIYTCLKTIIREFFSANRIVRILFGKE